jgi:hypothetical protein
MTNTAYTAPPELARFQQRALIVGALFGLVLIIGAFIDRAQFFRSYLIGFLFWTGIAVGSFALLMLQHLTGGGWGLVIRRPLEAAIGTLPLLVVLFIPIIIGLKPLYRWTNHEEMEKGGPGLVAKVDGYLNWKFFIVRTVVYFAIWLLLAFFLRKWSGQQDASTNRQSGKNMQVLSGPGLVLFVLTVTFASIDWAMSLSPEWSSTMYGLLFVAGWALSALAFAIATLAALTKHEPMSHVVAPLHFHDLGKLLLALVMLWTYFALSQYLIIWSGNLPEEIRWYLPRTNGGWGVIALLVLLLHFALPFLFLLSRSVKRNPHRLVLIAALILIMRCVDLIWLVEPNFNNAFHISWMDAVAPIAIGGLWLTMFAWQLGRRPLIPVNDPGLVNVLEQVHAGH